MQLTLDRTVLLVILVVLVIILTYNIRGYLTEPFTSEEIEDLSYSTTISYY